MPSQLALVLTVTFVVFLFARDVRQKPDVTGALWIPLIWLLISGSRFVSSWLALFGIGSAGGSLEDGSPLDRVVFTALIVAGVVILVKRRVKLFEIIRNNGWLTVYFVYCFIAIFWSDFPFIAFKRWIKTIGEPIMVLVLLTEPNASQALITLIKRGTYLIAPFSIMLIKYFPEIGRRASAWGGVESGGATGGKNALGYVCLVLGFFLFCHFLQTRKLAKSVDRRNELFLTAGLLWMVWWLVIESHSSTGLMSLIVGMLTVVMLAMPFVKKKFIGAYLVVGILTILAADAAFGLFAGVIDLLGEDSTLTGRTDLWDELLAMDINPFIGTGFESFWLGDRLKYLWSLHWWRPNEAHNGYIETYLNLGIVGLVILAGLIVATYRKSRRALLTDFEFGRARLGFLAAVVVYNWTEASFRALHLVFFAFYIIALDYPKRDVAARMTLGKPSKSDSETRKGPWEPRWSSVGRPTDERAARTLTPAPLSSRRVSMNWQARSTVASRHKPQG